MGQKFVRIFDERSHMWEQSRDMNDLIIRAQQNYMNHRLQAFGHVFLNEVYDSLGLSRTKQGATHGWHYSPGDYVDFNIFEVAGKRTKLYFNVEEIASLLPEEEKEDW